MTTEIELLPLPEWMSRYTIPSDGFECDKVAMLDDRMHDYARENVAHHTAALQAEIEALRAEVDALRMNDASVQPELVAVALAACDAVDDLIEKWYATRESGCLPNQVVRARGASKLLRAIALGGTK